MTIRAAQQALLAQLKTLYDEREASSIADWAMEYITGKPRIDRLLVRDTMLQDAQVSAFDRIGRELGAHTPIQYVLGEAWFAGMKFYVNEHVLIPRPETEELVNWAIQTIPADSSILDIGSGSGCIPISIANKLPRANITSIDISESAIAVAEKNAETLQATVDFLPFDFLDEAQWPRLEVFDVIVSNPPYIRQAEHRSMHRNVLDFEPHIALFVPDEDPLIFYRKIAVFAGTHLSSHGMIFLEINEALGHETEKLYREAGFNTELRKDLQGKDRMLRAVKMPGL